MYIDPGCGNPKPATPDPRDRTPAPRSRSPAASKKRKSRVPERRSRSPELNMRPMLGRLKNRKNRKNFGVQKSVRQLRFRQGFERFFGPGPNFRKKRHFWRHSAGCAGCAGTESRPAAQTLGTVRMLSGLRSWTSTNSLKQPKRFTMKSFLALSQLQKHKPTRLPSAKDQFVERK